MTHLSEREIELFTGPSSTVPSPTRVASIGHAALRIAGKRARLDGRRIGVLHPEPGAADALAQTLRQRGAQVAVLSLDPRHLARVEALDPEVIVVEPRHFTGECWPALAGVFAHPQLRWTCILVSAAEVLAEDGLEAHDIPGLSAQVQLLCTDYDAAVARARTDDAFDVALEALGPARVLRLLIGSGKSWRVGFATSALAVEIDLAEDLVVGVRGGYGRVDDTLLGTPALNVLLRETHGVVRARAVARPAVTNVMCPLDTALAAAFHGRKPPPERASLPALGAAAIAASADASVAKRLPAPPPATALSGVRNALSRTLIGVPALSSPAPVPKRSSQPEVAPVPAAPAEHAQPDNDNDTVQSFQRNSLPPMALSALLTSPPAASAMPHEGQAPRQSQPSAPPPAPSAAALGQPAPQRFAAAIPKPLFGFAAAAAIALGLMVAFDRAEGPAAGKRAVQVERQPEPAPRSVPGAVSTAQSSRAVEGAAIAQLPAAAQAAAAPAGPKPEVGAAAAAPAETQQAPEGPAASARALVAESDQAEEVAARDPAEALEEVSDPAKAGAASQRLSPAELRSLDKRATSLAKRGTSLLRKRQIEQAKAIYEEALQLAPRNTAALSGRVQVALKEGDATLALQHAVTLVDVRAKSATAQLLLGDAHRANAELEKARAAWERAAALGQPLARGRLSALEERSP